MKPGQATDYVFIATGTYPLAPNPLPEHTCLTSTITSIHASCLMWPMAGIAAHTANSVSSLACTQHGTCNEPHMSQTRAPRTACHMACRERGDPRLMLRAINPREAALADAAAGIHVRFRLGGSVFPPLVFYKIFTHR